MRAELAEGLGGALRAHMSIWHPELPAHLSREGRVQMIGELAEALLAGKQPDRAAALFLGGALLAWLEHGGKLERDYLKVSARAGSHQTTAAIWRGLKRRVPREEDKKNAAAIASRPSSTSHGASK